MSWFNLPFTKKTDSSIMEKNGKEDLGTNSTNEDNGSNEGEFRKVFVEDREPAALKKILHQNEEVKGIRAVHKFLSEDYETRGYKDALTNSDESYCFNNIELIKLDFKILLQQVTINYKKQIRSLDVFVKSGSRIGLIDMVEKLISNKEIVLDHLKYLDDLLMDMNNDTGLSQRIVLSYKSGFMRGIASLTKSHDFDNSLIL